MDYKVRLIIAIILFVLAVIAHFIRPAGPGWWGALVAAGLAFTAFALYDLAPA